MTSPRRAERGFSLIEFMVAMVMSLLMVYFIYVVLVNQTGAYRRQDLVMKMQQNLRFASEYIARSIQMAGYGTYGWTLSTIPLPAVTVIDGSGTEPDAIQVLYADPSRITITRWNETLPCDTDSIAFQDSTTIQYFSDVSWMLCFDYNSSAGMRSFLFQVDGVDGSAEVVNITTPTGGAEYDNTCDENLPPDMICAPAVWHLYYIDNSDSDDGGPGRPNRPMLMMRESQEAVTVGPVVPSRDDFPLADGIENLEVAVCMSGSDCFADSAWSDTLDSGSDVDQLRQVQIRLWARSERSALEGAPSPYVNPFTGAQDEYYRVASTTNVLVRNMRQTEDYN